MKQDDIPPNARRLLPVLLSALIAGSVACQSWWSPSSGYEPVGNPQLDFDATKAICEKEAAFTSADGYSHVNWNKFERCMKPRGWARP